MPRSLLPREHGAYVQLLAPLLATIVLYGATIASALLAIAACLAVAANEPLLVVLGHRGRRVRECDGTRARRRLALLVPATIAAGVAGLVLVPHVIAIAGIVAIAAAVLVGFAWRRAERSLAGEIVAAIALTGAAAPVAVAAGARVVGAVELWATWALGFIATVVAVHRVIARHKRAATWIDLAVVVVLAMLCTVAAISLAPALPLVATSLALVVIAPSTRHLRAIGFTLVGAAVASIAWWLAS